MSEENTSNPPLWALASKYVFEPLVIIPPETPGQPWIIFRAYGATRDFMAAVQDEKALVEWLKNQPRHVAPPPRLEAKPEPKPALDPLAEMLDAKIKGI